MQRYEKVSDHNNFILWHYYQFTGTQGTEGCNPTQVGFIQNQCSSGWLVTLFGDYWFQHRTKLMLSIAKSFENLQQVPINPQNTSTTSENTISPYSKPQPVVTMQSPHQKKSPASEIFFLPVTTKYTEGTIIMDKKPLGIPTAFGMHKAFNYATSRTSSKFFDHIVFNNVVTLEDI